MMWGAPPLAALIIGCGLYYVVQARRPMSDRSSEFVMAMVNGDAAGMLRYASKQERTDGGLTEERLQKVLDHLLTPYIKQEIPNGKLDFTNDSGGGHAISEFSGRSEGGHATAIAGDIYKTEDGLECNVLRTTLTNSWRLRFFRQNNLNAGAELFRAGLEGLAADRAFLEGIGLKGWVPIQPNMDLRLMTWDEIEERTRAREVQYAAKAP